MKNKSPKKPRGRPTGTLKIAPRDIGAALDHVVASKPPRVKTKKGGSSPKSKPTKGDVRGLR